MARVNQSRYPRGTGQKDQSGTGTWNIIRSMNQGKLDGVKPEMARVNTDILGISKLK